MRIKKLIYVPGFISLVGLPILLIFIGPEDPKSINCLSIYLPYDERAADRETAFSKYHVYEAIKGKKIVTIDLDDDRSLPGHDEMENYRFQRKDLFISHELERMQFTNDTSTVLRVNLGETNTYSDFIWVLNNALLYRVKRFAFMENSFYLLANPPIIHYPFMEYDPPANDLILETTEEKPTEWDLLVWRFEEKMKELSYLIRNNRIYLSAFLVFVIIPGLYFIKRNFHLNRLSSLLKPNRKENIE